MNRSVSKWAAALCAALLLPAAAAPARDWVVHPELGDDGNEGTAEAPLATAQAAIDRCGPGDRVVLQPAGAVYGQSIDLGKAPSGLVLDGNGVVLDGGGEREFGLVARGENRNVKVFQLAARNHRGSGFAISGESRGFQFFGISSAGNGRAGFEVSDRAECWIRGARFEAPPGAASFLSADAAESHHSDGSYRGEFRLVGGRHSLSRCELLENPDLAVLSVRAGPPGRGDGDGSASLVVQDLSFAGEAGGRPRVEIGPGSFVYHDAASGAVFSRMELERHPSAEFGESLFRTYPIGRDASGAPITAWAGGGTRYLPSNAYRIMHFGKHVPQEVAPKLSPDNDWLGLLAPLDTASFPPEGPAFAPEQASAHAIWRWIGLAAPDAVFVPDTPEGRALGEALRRHPPGDVGMVDVFLHREGADGRTESVVLPRLDGDAPGAKAEMLARVSRSPDEVLRQIAAHYGDRFGGSYIEALAVIARAEGGLPHRAAELAKEHLGKKPDLPANGGDIAGTLLYAMLDEDWARERVLAVADMAYDADGEPLEAMPKHNEMSDAVFMGGPVLAHAGRISGEGRYFDQALRNYRFIAGLCRRDDGIYRHSPLDEAAWGRGNGFPALGLALVLEQFPEDHEGHGEMREALVAHLEALAAHQDRDGMWHQIIDHPDSYAELTSTAMIAYAAASALERGWLDEAAWRPRLEAAWASVKMHAATDGRRFVNVCTGTGKQPSLEDYYRREAILGPDGRGAAMAMMLAKKLKNWQHFRDDAIQP